MKSLKEVSLEIPGHSKNVPHCSHYMDTYEQYFKGRRELPLTIMEIGVGKGGSLRIWRDYFPNAKVYGVDNEGFKEYHEDRIDILIGDQSSQEDMQRIINVTGPLDICIDDGGHQMYQQVTSLQLLWPIIKPSGLYIIEDLHTSYWPQFGGSIGDGQTTINFLKVAVDNLNAIHTTRQTFWTDDEYNIRMQSENPYIGSQVPEYVATLNKTLASIHFYDSLAILLKKG